MNTQAIRVLIAEDEYFIALEVERIVTEAGHCSVAICRRDDLRIHLNREKFDIVLVDAASSLDGCVQQADQINSAGAEPAFLCTHADLIDALQKNTGSKVFEKPLKEEEIMEFIVSRLPETGSQSNG